MAQVNFVIEVRVLVDPSQILLPMNMVGASVLGKLCMRKQNIKDNSTSGRGARASYQTMLPEISARRSLL